MDVFKGENILNLAKEFPDTASCKAYLKQIKWAMALAVLNVAITKGAERRGTDTFNSWPGTIPSHISKKYGQSYFDEFCFRINSSIFKGSVFPKSVERMVMTKPLYQSQILRNVSLEVKNLLKSGYPPPKEVAFRPICGYANANSEPIGRALQAQPSGHDHPQRRWVFKVN